MLRAGRAPSCVKGSSLKRVPPLSFWSSLGRVAPKERAFARGAPMAVRARGLAK
jgi:hypothetical protein